MTVSVKRKHVVGLALSSFLTCFCTQQLWMASGQMSMGLDLKGGSSFLIKLVHSPKEKITWDMLWQAVEIIRRRIDLLGVIDPIITPQGMDRILVQVPGIDTSQQLEETKTQLQRMAKLEFSSVHPDSQRLIPLIESGQNIVPPDYIIRTEKQSNNSDLHTKYLVKRKPEIQGDQIASSNVFFDQQGYGVILRLDSTGAKLLDELAEAHLGQPLAILLDGTIQSAPILKTNHYNGIAQITGHLTEKQARHLASVLQNPLRVPVEIEEIHSVSATLGRESVYQGLVAGLLGLASVTLFMAVYYRLAGLIAIFGLAVNMLLLLGMMAMFRFALTLPGIAGIILTIGMAIDASVLVYERLREELRVGASLEMAINRAYAKASRAILDANITTLLTGLILFWQASGAVRGFAITLTLGILTSLFSSLIFTRNLFHWMITKGSLRRLYLPDWMPKRNFNFLGKKKLATGISILLLIGSCVFVIVRWDNNLGIDFLGGDLLVVQYRKPIALEEVHHELNRLGLGGTTFLQLTHGVGPAKIIIRSPQGSAKKVLTTLSNAFANRGLLATQQDTVGARVGAEFAKKSVFALCLSLAAIFCYVAIRFGFSFALGAIVALLHDVLLTIGLFAFTGGVFSLVLVGAILIIIGYSINDTIVVFDRIREKWWGNNDRSSGSIETLINHSINESLGRTVLTSATTLLPVLALYFIGGKVLQDFALVILIGVLAGTYSSVFVASPIAIWCTRR